jgi:glutaryl-CoA dehydrogenase
VRRLVLDRLTSQQIDQLAEISRTILDRHRLDRRKARTRAALVAAAREIAEARDLLGGNGILLDFHVMRHMADIEAIHTYEGTEAIQTLIVGRDITGVGAFT